jgi:hypothetical protein
VWPSSSPAAPTDPAVSDLELIQRLMPQVLRLGLRDCEGIDPGMAGEVTALSCTRDDALVVYRLFTDAEARDGAFASLIEQAPAPDATAGSCSDGAFRGEVTEGDRTWSMACWMSSSGPVLLWTEPAEPVLGAILAPAGTDVVAVWEAGRLPG